jgi:hypothetical protein
MEQRNDMMGHNNPPSETVPAHETPEYKELAARGAVLAEAASRIPNADEKGASEKLVTYVKMGKVFIKKVNDWHKAAKAPHIEKGRAVDTAKNEAIDVIDEGMKKANAQLNIIAQELHKAEDKRQRIAQEKANKARIEAEHLELDAKATNDAVAATQAQEAAKVAAKHDKEAQAQTSSIKTDEGASVSFKKTWTFEIENHNQIPVAVLRKYMGDEAFNKAMRAAIRDGVREIKGVRIFQETNSTVR